MKTALCGLFIAMTLTFPSDPPLLYTFLAPMPLAPSCASFLLVEIFSFIAMLEVHGLRLGWEQGKGDGM